MVRMIMVFTNVMMVMDNIDADVFSVNTTHEWWNGGNIDDGDDVQSEAAQKQEGYWRPLRGTSHLMTLNHGQQLTFDLL